MNHLVFLLLLLFMIAAFVPRLAAVTVTRGDGSFARARQL